MSDAIPIVEVYRGVGLHDQQPEERLALVRAEIDRVFLISDPQELFAIVKDVMWAPEARLFAKSKIEAILDNYTYNREARPHGITIELLRAHTAGLAVARCRDLNYYCSSVSSPMSQKARRRDGVGSLFHIAVTFSTVIAGP